ncbi:hypothetical protein niasHT_022664 [Heterodera trifolii]|uniref:Dynamin-binding protein n=1 Tax=Heterodera trifolii TaxID=157864 RepID=A0ABD2JRK6_9BILA
MASSRHIYDFPTDLVLKGDSASVGASILEGDRPYCRALYEFRSEFPNELEFSAGDLIFIEKRKNNEWLEGECQSNGRKGIFPQNFVDIVVPLRDEEEVTTDCELSVPFSSVASGANFNDQIGVASALYDFEPRFDDELRLRIGESVQVLELVGTEWAKCRETTSGFVGIVPQRFLNIFFDATADEESQFGESPTGENERSNDFTDQLKPWDVPIFQSSNVPSIQKQESFSCRSSLSGYDSAQWVGSTDAAISHRPPPRPPPPKLCQTTVTLPKAIIEQESPALCSSSSTFSMKSSSEKESSSFLRKKHSEVTSPRRHFHQSHQYSVELVDEADENLQLVKGVGRGVLPDSVNPQLMQNAASVSKTDSKQKVVLDLLNTERAYLFDLNTWESSIKESAELSAEDKKALTNGYAPLKQLSQTLISTIMAQKDLSSVDQHFGNAFMELKERFFVAYAYHFRYVEQISVIVENEEDQSLQNALQKCLLAMRQKGSSVFDVPTAVSRPIQRCLKYPLYVGELLKNTPIHHPDHPKLMESLRQFGTLASRMNECKRRKELIRKYRSQEQLSLADRLSRINMHSLVKKSNRLKYRINRSIGLNTARYTEFDYLVQLLEEAERRLCKFLYCAQLYKKHIEQSVKRHEDTYKGICHAQDENVVKAFAVMFRRLDELCRRHLQTFDQEVITEGKKLVRSDLAKLVHKRFDKLADYETAKATHKNSDEVEMRRAEFEALNNQIKAQLPRVIGSINMRVRELIQRVNELDEAFLCRMDEWFARERPEKVRDCFSAALPFRAHLSASHRHTLAELNKIAAHLSSGSNPLQKKKSLRLSFRGTKSTHFSNESEAQKKQQKTHKRRPQTTKERDALTKICHAQKLTQQLRRVQSDWESASMILRRGDAVVVKALRQDGFSLCDNAVSSGLVPVALLGPFDESFTAPFSPESPASENEPHANDLAVGHKQNNFDVPLLLLDFITANETNSSQNDYSPDKMTSNSQLDKIDQNGRDINLIDLEDNLIDLDSPPKVNVQPRELKPISSYVDEQPESFLSKNFGNGKPEKIGRLSSPSPPVPPIPDRPMSASNCQPPLPTPISNVSSLTDFATSATIQPIRIAPPPPPVTSSRQLDTTPQRQAVSAPVETQQPHLPNPTHNGVCPSQFPPHSFAVCVFDFVPALTDSEHLEAHQLAITEGEVVEIIRRNDDAGNNEWWLVRKRSQHNHCTDQQQGYVPANYLSCLKTPLNTRV